MNLFFIRFIFVFLLFCFTANPFSIAYSVEYTSRETRHADNSEISRKIASLHHLTAPDDVISRSDNILKEARLTVSQRLEVLAIQASSYQELGDLNKAILLSQKSLTIANNAQLQAKAAQANKMLGVYHYYQGNYPKAISFYQASMAYFESSHEQLKIANLHNNIGLVYSVLGDVSQTLASYQAAESIYQEVGSAVDKIDIRYNIAILYMRLYRHSIASDMLIETIEKRTKLQDELGVAEAQVDLAVSYKHLGEYSKSLDLMEDSLAYFERVKNQYNLASLLHNLSEVYLEMLNVEKAIYYALQAKELSEELGHNSAYVGSLHSLAAAYFQQNKIAEALKAIEESNELAKKMGYQQQVSENLSLLSLIYAAEHNTKGSWKAHRQSLIEKNKRSNNEISFYMAQFESEQLHQKVANLEQQKQLTELATQRTNQQRSFIIIISLFLLILAFFIYRRNIDRRSKKILSGRVKFRTQELELLTSELVKANAIKSQFLANMSHEIRTPLTSIIGQAEAIISGDIDEEKLQKEIGIIHGNSLHLLELINNILDLSKIEANKLTLEIREQDLQIILYELANMFTEQAKKKGIVFEITHALPSPFIINIDGFRLKQILINLCSNAIKFTRKGNVLLNVFAKDDQLIFKLTDSGIGMSATQLKEIFESFTQGDSSISRRFGGSGLGLCLSDQLAKLMQGKIVAESTLNQGSTFTFQLSCESICQSACQLNEHEKTNELEVLEPIKVPVANSMNNTELFSGEILLADDHDDNRRLITRLLMSLGLEVLTATNGKEAIELYSHCQPKLILMDIQMPEMDGIEAFKVLRQQGCTQPIYALTANAMSHEVEQYLALGFNGHLKKPIERKRFIATIARYYGNNVKIANVEKVAEDQLENVELSDLVVQFKSNLVLEQQDLILHFKNNDLEKLAQLAHRIAGAGQMFGFNAVAECAMKLEVNIKASNQPLISQYLQSLLNEIDQVLW
jgi:signal transduction histidine kinase/DNA-binding response OmpR family regulator